MDEIDLPILTKMILAEAVEKGILKVTKGKENGKEKKFYYFPSINIKTGENNG